MHVEGIFDIASFKFIPWGNSYFGGLEGDTQYCQKTNPAGCNTKNGLEVWLDTCDAGARHPVPADCWKKPALCQDGPNECLANKIQNCVVHLIKEKQQLAGRSDSKPEFWNFIACFENYTIPEDPSNDVKAPIETLSKCEKHLSHDDALAVKQCYEQTEGLGSQLEIDAANATASLSPRHALIPWILVDGQQTAASQVLAEVCKRYHGPKPAACQRRFL